ncbi:hypothetical protein [Mucilaginibacter sp.]|jgi:hypothetical protein|uniref:hypothetical protein n=1 Tax=Mucilaginibacter sp. TaxID=1882438 RepID=UPI002C77E456|nr:hypothetical protein [Mucilaginibacter sp.]HTI57767.1 hypothetical protein [Mucilaginibacter sp.]
MTNKIVDFQAKVYVYDLNNCAREFGFKDDEGWELSLATQDERKALEKKYYPIVSTKVLPEILVELFGLVKDKLEQARSNIQNQLDAGNKADSNMQYLVAFNPKRHR